MNRILSGILLVMLILSVLGCSNKPKEPEKPAFNPSYKVLEEKDLSTGYAIRRTMRISVPTGLDRQAMNDNIMHAAKSMENVYPRPDKGFVAEVYVFTHEDAIKTENGQYVKPIAECTYAPNGEWTNSTAKYSPKNMQAKIHIQEDYYNRK